MCPLQKVRGEILKKKQVAFPFYCYVCKTHLCPEKGNTTKELFLY